ncbi:MAG TPA: TonB family protein [Chryseolinea sp.]|nr:TonB family protein [Chryseolinea sp.]
MKQKIKVMEHRPELSDEEIRSYMNFDSLMANKKQLTKATRWGYALKGGAVVAIIVAGWVFFNSHTDTKTSTLPLPEQQPQSAPQTPIESTPEHAENTTVAPMREKNANRAPSKAKKATDPAVVEVPAAENIYLQAEPLDGYPALYDYLNNNINYPYESIKDSIQGVQTVSFVINAEGKPENIIIRQSLGEAFDVESKRLITSMPSWKPATLNGKPVASQMSIPLTFQFEKTKSKKP